MSKSILLLLVAAGFWSTCAAQTREENITAFLGYLKTNNEQKIYDISYHRETKNAITDGSLRKQAVAHASEFLAKYWISPRIKWYTEQIPGGASWLYIPLFAGSDTTTIQAIITLKFPPAVVSNKVYDFEVEKRNIVSKGVIEAPKRTNR